MEKLNAKKLRYFANFLNSLARDLTNFYYKKLDKPFKVVNKLKSKGYDQSLVQIRHLKNLSDQK